MLGVRARCEFEHGEAAATHHQGPGSSAVLEQDKPRSKFWFVLPSTASLGPHVESPPRVVLCVVVRLTRVMAVLHRRTAANHVGSCTTTVWAGAEHARLPGRASEGLHLAQRQIRARGALCCILGAQADDQVATSDSCCARKRVDCLGRGVV